MFVYIYEDGRVDWSEQLGDFDSQKFRVCRDMFEFYLEDDKLMYVTHKGENILEED